MLITRLCEPQRFPHPVDSVETIETHISVVIMAGAYAYKLKKPYNLEFLDFTTLGARAFFCQEELRLNQRLAPDLYLSVVPITGTVQNPHWGGAGSPIEYAVKMKRFPQSALLSHVIARNGLTTDHMATLAQRIAHFHQAQCPAGAHQEWGTPKRIHAAVNQNYAQITSLLTQKEAQTRLQQLGHLTDAFYSQHRAAFVSRKQQGFIRECHGDLHLNNLILFHDEVVPFDCIEFNEDFRWIDVMSEVAFLVMDLTHLGRSDLGFHFLNIYLEQTGDFDGLELLPYYLMFRALVRAKIVAFRAAQSETPESEKTTLWNEYQHYVDLAFQFGQHQNPRLLLMHGVSGSGKSTVARSLSMLLPAIHIRSDVERKRLHGLDALARSGSGKDGGIYDAETTTRTYEQLAKIAAQCLSAGLHVIVDATFLDPEHRKLFATLAAHPLVIHCHAPTSLLNQRVQARYRAGTDAAEADVAILARQLNTQPEMHAESSNTVISVDTSREIDYAALAAQLLNPPDRVQSLN